MPPTRAEPRTRRCLLSVPSGVPFLETLAEALLDGGLVPGLKPLGGDPLALSEALIFLPTRRAAKEFEAIVSEMLGGAALLPRVLTLGGLGEDEDFEDPAGGGAVIGETERRLVLARFIRDWARIISRAVSAAPDEADLISTSPAEAMSLAIALGQLIDSFETEGADWEKLAKLVPPEHDTIWQLTTSFLNLAAEAWPQHLKDEGKLGRAARHNAMLRALAERLRENPPQTPVIVAGSTGSNPATADLMRVVAQLPYGAVVLHGLDVRADAETWAAIGGAGTKGEVPAQAWTHPQHAFHRLLARLDVQPGEVGLIGKEDAARDRRRALISQAMLPSDLTDRWTGLSIDAATALDGVTLVEAANEREEALGIAIALREALEQPRRTAALVTPDRNLARRVSAELMRWGIVSEDSAGLPLADSPAGILARLVAEAAADDLEPQSLIALLRHGHTQLGWDGKELLRAADALEIGVLRGAAPPPGADGLLQKLTLEEVAGERDRYFWHGAKRALRPEEWDGARKLVGALRVALEPLCAYVRSGREAPLADILVAHRDALEAVRLGGAADRDHAELLAFFDEALKGPSAAIHVRLAGYPVLFKTMLRGKTAKSVRPVHPRLKILGTLEARLLGFDRVVLGGLNETNWPAPAENDPFLSRPMRGALGLPPPEWRTGQQAHDFEQLMGGGDVVLTRSLKAGGAPSVAARWLQRLEAVAGAEVWAELRARGENYLAFAAALDAAPGPPPRLQRPEPRPRRELRPASLSVTEIETLIRDPYAIYARHVLKLSPLEKAGELPQASDRGTIIHDALAEFAQNHDVMAADAEDRLIDIGRRHFQPYWDFPDVRALWWPRFERIVRWYVGWERERRPRVDRMFTEVGGRIEWDTAEGRPFRLRGRADRFDAMGGGYSVIDYKTGTPPGSSEVRAGFAPQLPLEAAILAQGGFDGVPAGEPLEYLYVRLSGQNDGGEERRIEMKDGLTPQALADEKLDRLKKLIDIYEQEDTPYLSNTRPKFLRLVSGDYDHLARYAEWSLAPEPGEEDENGA